MTEVSKMSDFELNANIARFDKGLAWMAAYPSEQKVIVCNLEGKSVYKDVDYCNNWNDLMPLFLEHRIIAVPYKDDLWEVYHHEYSDCIQPRYPDDDNLQRALAECIYLVLQEKANEK